MDTSGMGPENWLFAKLSARILGIPVRISSRSVPVSCIFSNCTPNTVPLRLHITPCHNGMIPLHGLAPRPQPGSSGDPPVVTDRVSLNRRRTSASAANA